MNKSVLATILAAVIMSLPKRKGGRSLKYMDRVLGTKNGQIIIDFRVQYAFRTESTPESMDFKVIRQPHGAEIVGAFERRDEVTYVYDDATVDFWEPQDYIKSIEIIREYPSGEFDLGRDITHSDLYQSAVEVAERDITEDDIARYAEQYGLDIDDVSKVEVFDEWGYEPSYDSYQEVWENERDELGTCNLEVRFYIDANESALKMDGEHFYNACQMLIYNYLDLVQEGQARLLNSEIIQSFPSTLPVRPGNITDVRRF